MGEEFESTEVRWGTLEQERMEADEGWEVKPGASPVLEQGQHSHRGFARIP